MKGITLYTKLTGFDFKKNRDVYNNWFSNSSQKRHWGKIRGKVKRSARAKMKMEFIKEINLEL